MERGWCDGWGAGRKVTAAQSESSQGRSPREMDEKVKVEGGDWSGGFELEGTRLRSVKTPVWYTRVWRDENAYDTRNGL